jgi:hypothetical protein
MPGEAASPRWRCAWQRDSLGASGLLDNELFSRTQVTPAAPVVRDEGTPADTSNAGQRAAPLRVPETFPLLSDEPRHIRWPWPPEHVPRKLGTRVSQGRGAARRLAGVGRADAGGSAARCPAWPLTAGAGPSPCGAAVARQRGQRQRTCSTWRRVLGRLGASAAASCESPPGSSAHRLPPPLPPPARCAPGLAQEPCALRVAEPPPPDGPRRARPPGPAADMGALLLLLLLAQWLLRAAPALAPAPFTLPLQVAAATSHVASSPTPGPGTPVLPRADGLALALEPAGSAANFLAMVDNLQGDSGRGYYLEMLIGTPPQKVGRWALAHPPRNPAPSWLQSRAFAGLVVGYGAPRDVSMQLNVAPEAVQRGSAAGEPGRALAKGREGSPCPGRSRRG